MSKRVKVDRSGKWVITFVAQFNDLPLKRYWVGGWNGKYNVWAVPEGHAKEYSYVYASKKMKDLAKYKNAEICEYEMRRVK